VPFPSTTLLPLTFEDNLDKSASIALPINVNPGSSDSFNLMRHWIRCCETSHNCGFTKAPDYMPSMLLDVQSLASEDCVKIIKVSETMKERYLSLSYCWGAAAQKVMNLKDIRERLLTGIRSIYGSMLYAFLKTTKRLKPKRSPAWRRSTVAQP
jgi:hypothetical protein